MELIQFFLELLAVEAKIKGVFSRSCCCHGNTLSCEILMWSPMIGY